MATVAFSTSAAVPAGAPMAAPAAAAAAARSSSSAREKYSASGCRSQFMRMACSASRTGFGAAPKEPWFSRATFGAWCAKSSANCAAGARVKRLIWRP